MYAIMVKSVGSMTGSNYVHGADGKPELFDTKEDAHARRDWYEQRCTIPFISYSVMPWLAGVSPAIHPRYGEDIANAVMDINRIGRSMEIYSQHMGAMNPIILLQNLSEELQDAKVRLVRAIHELDVV